MYESSDLQNELIFRSLRSPGELFDFSGSVLRSIAKRVIALVTFPTLLGIAAFVLLSVIALPYFFLTNKNTIAEQAGEILIFGLGGLIIFLVIASVLIAYAGGIIIEGSWAAILGRTGSSGQWADTASANLNKLIGVSLRTIAWPVAYMLAGLILVMAPGAIEGQDGNAGLGLLAGIGVLWLLAGFALVPLMINKRALAPVLVLREGLSPAQAIKRSRELTARAPGVLNRGMISYSGQDMLNNVWGIALLVGVGLLIAIPSVLSEMGIDSLVSSATGSITASTFATVLGILPLFVAIMLMQLLWFCSCTVLYLDRIIQLEGYDVILLRDRQKRSRGLRYEA